MTQKPVRYSKIPAAAITDPEIAPRDLQVLCLLGRHIDAEGWCRRSQVRMAEELHCGRATIQRALERLEGAGYVERVAEGRPGVDVESGGHPFASYAFRVVFRADDVPTNGQGVPTDEHRVPAQSGHGVPISRAPIIELTPLELPPDNARRARVARSSSDLSAGASAKGEAVGQPKTRQQSLMLPIEGGAKPATADFDGAAANLLLAEFERLPGYNPNWRLPDVRAGLAALGEDRPPDSALIGAVRRYGQWLATRNAERARHRDGREPMTKPSNWLALRCYERFLEPEGAAAAPEAAPLADEAWKPWRASAAAAIGGDKVFDRWLASTGLDLADDRVTITVDVPFRRDWIATNFGRALGRVFEREVVVALRPKARVA